jgi:hypothetical protein
MGERLNVVDCSGLTDADWAAVNRVNRACELGGAIAFWEELEKLTMCVSSASAWCIFS